MYSGWWGYLRIYPWKNFLLRLAVELLAVFGGLTTMERYLPGLKALNDWLASEVLILVAVTAYFAVIRFFWYDVLVAQQHADLSGDATLAPPRQANPEVQLPLGLPEPDQQKSGPAGPD